MYSIQWYSNNKNILVVGDLSSILAVANLLENNKQAFQVSSCNGFRVSQEEMGCGGFAFWTPRPKTR
jgi:hypothetical protein